MSGYRPPNVVFVWRNKSWSMVFLVFVYDRWLCHWFSVGQCLFLWWNTSFRMNLFMSTTTLFVQLILFIQVIWDRKTHSLKLPLFISFERFHVLLLRSCTFLRRRTWKRSKEMNNGSLRRCAFRSLIPFLSPKNLYKWFDKRLLETENVGILLP